MLNAECRARLVHCRELEYILLGDLRDLLEEEPNSETVRWLAAVLDTLLETLPEDFELRSAEGYLQPVLDAYPHWEPLVERLENQHFELFRRLNTLRSKLTLGQDFSPVAEILRGDLAGWIVAFRVHREHEQRLVLLSTHLDEGWGG